MNQKTLVDVFPPVSQPCPRNFVRENVLRVRNMRGAPNKRAKTTGKPTQIQQTRSMSGVDENRPAPSRPKPHVRRPVGIRNVNPRTNTVATCDRGIQTESTGELQQAPSCDHPVRPGNFGHGDSATADCIGTTGVMGVASLPDIKDEKVPVGKFASFATGGGSAIIGYPIECVPGGLVKLSNEDHAETLRVLMENYQEKIRELNTMPVRNDTLKIQRRRKEIEDELRKIDNGIKIFQRGQVFIKSKK